MLKRFSTETLGIHANRLDGAGAACGSVSHRTSDISGTVLPLPHWYTLGLWLRQESSASFSREEMSSTEENSSPVPTNVADDAEPTE